MKEEIFTTFKKNDNYWGPRIGIYKFKIKEPLLPQRIAEIDYNLDDVLLIDEDVADAYLLDIIVRNYDSDLIWNEYCLSSGIHVENYYFLRYGYKNFYTFNQFQTILSEVEGRLYLIKTGETKPKLYEYLSIDTKEKVIEIYERFIIEIKAILDDQDGFDGVVVEGP